MTVRGDEQNVQKKNNMKKLSVSFLTLVCFGCFGCVTPQPNYTTQPADEPKNVDTVTDIDGNVYTTVKIGNQIWTVENLRTTKYNDGTPIPLVTDNTAWAALRTQGYCYYHNTTDTEKIKKYGALYNWYVVETKKLAPKGWHVPSDYEWNVLEDYLIANGYNWDGSKVFNKTAKSVAAKTDWVATREIGTAGYDLTKNNKSGFSAIPSGFREHSGDFILFGYISRWWSTTEYDVSHAYLRNLHSTFVSMYRGSTKRCGYSVRLVKDE